MLDETKHDFEEIKRLTREQFVKDGKIDGPYCYLKRPDGAKTRVDSLGAVMTDQGAQLVELPNDQFIAVVQAMAHRYDCTMACLVAECWMRATNAETPEQARQERALLGPLADQPDSIEVVMLQLEDQSGRETWMARIIRGDRTARLSGWVMEGQESIGRMARLLPDRPANQQAGVN